MGSLLLNPIAFFDHEFFLIANIGWGPVQLVNLGIGSLQFMILRNMLSDLNPFLNIQHFKALSIPPTSTSTFVNQLMYSQSFLLSLMYPNEHIYSGGFFLTHCELGIEGVIQLLPRSYDYVWKGLEPHHDTNLKRVNINNLHFTTLRA